VCVWMGVGFVISPLFCPSSINYLPNNSKWTLHVFAHVTLHRPTQQQQWRERARDGAGASSVRVARGRQAGRSLTHDSPPFWPLPLLPLFAGTGPRLNEKRALCLRRTDCAMAFLVLSCLDDHPGSQNGFASVACVREGPILEERRTCPQCKATCSELGLVLAENWKGSSGSSAAHGATRPLVAPPPPTPIPDRDG